MARTVLGEGRGEDDEGMAAIASVIRNRALNSGKGISEIILQPNQFSAWDKNDPNREYMLSLTQDNDDFLRALEIVRGVLSGETEDPTGGATHYVNPETASSSSLKWRRKLKNLGMIGNHEFYADPEHRYAEGGIVNSIMKAKFPNPLRAFLSQEEIDAIPEDRAQDIIDALAKTGPIKWGNREAEKAIENPLNALGTALLVISGGGLATQGLKIAGKYGLGALAGGAKAAKTYPKIAAGITGLGLLGLGNSEEDPRQVYAEQQKAFNAIAEKKAQQQETKTAAKETAASLIKAMHGGASTPSTTTNQNYTPAVKAQEKKEGVNKPLLAFGATLLNSDEGFFKALGQAGQAYVSTADQEEMKIRDTAKENAELELKKIRTALYGKQIEASLADNTNPWESNYKMLRALELSKKLQDGGFSARRDKIFETMVSSGLVGNSEEALADAMKKATNLAMQHSVATGGDSEQMSPEIIESNIIDAADYFGQ